MKIMLIIFTSIVLTSCNSISDDFALGKKQLETQGYSNIEKRENNFTDMCSCSEYEYSIAFKATNKNGDSTEGVFCTNGVGGITIRYTK